MIFWTKNCQFPITKFIRCKILNNKESSFSKFFYYPYMIDNLVEVDKTILRKILFLYPKITGLMLKETILRSYVNSVSPETIFLCGNCFNAAIPKSIFAH